MTPRGARIAGILLAIYILAIVGVIVWPARRHHPEDGQAVGCLRGIKAKSATRADGSWVTNLSKPSPAVPTSSTVTNPTPNASTTS
ncbi:MAG TPA: hypothetical protein VKT80_04635 [Chloroflexota bacterium]|nr:hypothetical protein [Chloroflexota bacterium]